MATDFKIQLIYGNLPDAMRFDVNDEGRLCICFLSVDGKLRISHAGAAKTLQAVSVLAMDYGKAP